MKSPALVLCTIATVFAALSAPTHAATCTTEQIMSISSLPEIMKIATDCSGITVDTTKALDATNKAFCSNAKCLAAITAAASAMPQCDIGGTNLAASYSSVVTACKASSPASTVALGTAAVAVSGVVGIMLATI